MRSLRIRVGLAAAVAAALFLLAFAAPARADGGRPTDRAREEEAAEAPDTIRLGFRVGIWTPLIVDLDARQQVNGAGATVDLQDLGDLGDIEYAPNLGAWIDLGRWVSIDVDYVGLWLEGEGLVGDAPIVFDGTTFAPGESVDTRLSLHMADVALRINALDTDLAQLALRLGGRYVSASTRLRATGRTARSDLDGVIPFVGVALSLSPAEGVGVFGSVKAGLVEYDGRGSWWFGASSSAGGREHHMLDAELGVSFAPSDRVGVILSYRWVDVSIDREDEWGDHEELDAVLQGPQLSVFFAF